MKPPAAERTRPTPWDVLVALAVAAAAVALLFLLKPAGGGNFLTARVVLDGELVAEYDLSALTGPVTLPLDGAAYPMVVEAQPGRIRILESACPGQDCVRTGWADRAGAQIICLPNRLVISLTGSDAPPFDAVTG